MGLPLLFRPGSSPEAALSGRTVLLRHLISARGRRGAAEMKIILDLGKVQGCGLCMDVHAKGVMEFREDTNSRGCRTVVVGSSREVCFVRTLCCCVPRTRHNHIKNDGKRGVRTPIPRERSGSMERKSLKGNEAVAEAAILADAGFLPDIP